MTESLIQSITDPIFDIFDPAPSLTGHSKAPDWLNIYPIQGSSLTTSNASGTQYAFRIPAGLYDLKNSYLLATIHHYKTGTTALDSYATGTETTHVARQNPMSLSFIQRSQVMINGKIYEENYRPYKFQVVKNLINMSTDYYTSKAYESGFYLDVGADTRTSGNTGFVSRATNSITAFDENYICRFPVNMIYQRSTGTYIPNNFELVLIRDSDTDMQELGTAAVGEVKIVSLRLMVKRLNPLKDVEDMIFSNFSKGMSEVFSFENVEYVQKTVTASDTIDSFLFSLKNRPKAIIFGQCPLTYKNKTNWVPNGLRSYRVEINGDRYPMQQITIDSYTATGNQYSPDVLRAISDLFEVFSKHVDRTDDGWLLTESTWATNYTLFGIDTSLSNNEEVADLHKPLSATNCNLTLEYAAATASANVDIWFIYDKAICITGPNMSVSEII